VDDVDEFQLLAVGDERLGKALGLDLLLG
jgi:hypothetical protein